MYKRIRKNQIGATAILLTFLMLSGITLVALITGDLVQNGIVASRTQVNSTKALFAAETGIEQVLDSVWKQMPVNGVIQCQGADSNSGYVCFDAPQDGAIDNTTGGDPFVRVCSDDCGADFPGTQEYFTQTIDGGAEFYVLYNKVTSGSRSTTTFTSVGTFANVNRVVESSYVR